MGLQMKVRSVEQLCGVNGDVQQLLYKPWAVQRETHLNIGLWQNVPVCCGPFECIKRQGLGPGDYRMHEIFFSSSEHCVFRCVSNHVLEMAAIAVDSGENTLVCCPSWKAPQCTFV